MSGLREAVREELRRRNGGGGKPDKGPGDLVRADREAGRNIQRDTDTWTVATPEEFRQGMKVAPSKGPDRTKRQKSDEEIRQEAQMLLAGRRKGYAAGMREKGNPYDRTWKHYVPMGGHGARTYSEQFTEPGDGARGYNAEEDALIRERDRLDPYGKPTDKMRVQEEARQAIIDEYKKRRGGRRR